MQKCIFHIYYAKISGKHYKGGYRNIKIIEENGPDDEMDNTEI
jgi:hypothetical protein